MIASFLLAWRALMRAHVLLVLLVTAGTVHFFLPDFVRSDGTASGDFEMFVRSVPGCVFFIVCLAVLVCACGVLARERESGRLPLTVLRPVSAPAVMVGRWFALCALAAAVLLPSCALTVWQLRVRGPLPLCRHHFAPTMPSPESCAREALSSYLNDPTTPEDIRKASRTRVLALLTAKEMDRYDVVPAGQVRAWPFKIPAETAACGAPIVRLRCVSTYDLRTDLRGKMTFGVFSSVVSNQTQSVLDIPLAAVSSNGGDPDRLCFENTGKSSILLRPRRDIEILFPADSFVSNSARAFLLMLVQIAFLAAFGLFLSSALSTPVAVFTAVLALIVALTVPDVIIQFPDGLSVPLSERLGIALSRAVYAVTSTLSAPQPIADLAMSRCVEWHDLLRTALCNALLIPSFLLSAAAFFIRRRALPDRS